MSRTICDPEFWNGAVAQVPPPKTKDEERQIIFGCACLGCLFSPFVFLIVILGLTNLSKEVVKAIKAVNHEIVNFNQMKNDEGL